MTHDAIRLNLRGAAAALAFALSLAPAESRRGGEALLNIYNGEYERASERYPVAAAASAEARSAASEKREEMVASAKGRLRVAAERLRRLAVPTAAGDQDGGLTELAETLEFYGAPQEMREPPLAFKQSEVSTKAIIIDKPEPGFTEEARRNLTSGRVTLRAVLAADGRVRYISVVKGLPDGLTERCIEAARKIRFKPATIGSLCVSQYVVLEYNFIIG
jgi:TonB family protein